MSNARKLADSLPIDGQIGIGRNMLINGDMSIAQREVTSYAVGDGNAYKNVDRWKVFASNTAGRCTMQQNTDAPPGFNYSLKFSCTTADTSIAANESFIISQAIEAQNCTLARHGTSEAKQITLSFYAKADSTKTYVVQILNNKHSGYIHNNRTFTVTSSWQRFEMTFQADTTADSKMDGTLTDAGFSVMFYLHAGSDFTSATLASDWATGTTNRAAGTQSIFSSTNNRFYLTGCQLEVGPQSTPFEHEPVGVTLSKCQRYYQTIISNNQNGTVMVNRNRLNTNEYSGTAYAPSKMRGLPNITSTGLDRFHKPGVTYDTISTLSVATNDTDGKTARVNLIPTTNHTDVQSGWLGSSGGSGKIIFDAEL
tara:strand:- start:200 stop:1303 length:1104 start_codon:yes stop_codon:yes gene_type:complete